MRHFVSRVLKAALSMLRSISLISGTISSCINASRIVFLQHDLAGSNANRRDCSLKEKAHLQSHVKIKTRHRP